MRALMVLLLLLPLAAGAQKWSNLAKLQTGETVEIDLASFGYSRDTAYNGGPTHGGATFRVTTPDDEKVVFSFVLERMDCNVGFGSLQVQMQNEKNWLNMGSEFWREERSDLYGTSAKKICAMDAQYQQRLKASKP